MGKFIDITGQTFGKWKVIRYIGNSLWECINNTTGETKNIHSYTLRKRHSGKKVTSKKTMELEGKKFGLWEVLEYTGGIDKTWKCKCDCGTIANVKEFDLIHNKSTKCNNPVHRNKKDLTGQTFGELTVQYYAGKMRWHCVCSCGNEKDILTRYLLDGTSKSCGHDRNYHIVIKDITGNIYGSLEVLGYTGKNNMWTCRCKECGTIKDIHRNSLVSGKVKSCGCLKEKMRVETLLQRYGDTNTTRIDNPREEWQREVIENQDRFKLFLNTLGKDKSITELAELLDITEPSLAKAIKRLNLTDLVRHTASGESEIEKSLVNYIQSIYKGNIILHDRSILNGKELDIYIPDKKLAIEFNGNFWHSSEYKDIGYHQNKTIECAKKNIRLIHVFEYEWRDGEKRRIIQQLFHSILSDSIIYYGRNTKVQEIDGTIAKEFLTKYHLQGYASSNISLGCYINNELIGVMTFGKPRFSNEYEYELVRLCWKSGIKVIGGAAKLFKYFTENYKPNSIVSYCDISKFSGNVYTKLGFKTQLSFITKPSYVWVNNHIGVLHRYQTQKSELIKAGLGNNGHTEDEIMKNLGYFKIYNSGNLKFVWLE